MVKKYKSRRNRKVRYFGGVDPLTTEIQFSATPPTTLSNLPPILNLPPTVPTSTNLPIETQQTLIEDEKTESKPPIVDPTPFINSMREAINANAEKAAAEENEDTEVASQPEMIREVTKVVSQPETIGGRRRKPKKSCKARKLKKSKKSKKSRKNQN